MIDNSLHNWDKIGYFLAISKSRHDAAIPPRLTS
jgi:hypothetical protein